MAAVGETGAKAEEERVITLCGVVVQERDSVN